MSYVNRQIFAQLNEVVLEIRFHLSSSLFIGYNTNLKGDTVFAIY